MPKCWACGSTIHISQEMKLVPVEIADRTVKMAHHDYCAENLVTDLQLAEDRVAPICDELNLSDDVRQLANRYAYRSDMVHPVNRSPSVVAAGCVYLASVMKNEKRTQPTVAKVAGANPASIREAYHEIGEHEGIPIGRSSDDVEEEKSLADRVKETLRL